VFFADAKVRGFIGAVAALFQAIQYFLEIAFAYSSSGFVKRLFAGVVRLLLGLRSFAGVPVSIASTISAQSITVSARHMDWAMPARVKLLGFRTKKLPIQPKDPTGFSPNS
jgi:hypothetical protein